MSKLEHTSGKVREHEHQLREVDRQLDVMEEADEEQDKLIAEAQRKDKEHDRVLGEMAKADEEQDKLIAEALEKDKKHDRALEEMAKADEEQDKLIAEGQKKDEEHDQVLEEMIRADEEQDKIINRQAEEILELKKEIQILSEKINKKSNNKVVVMIGVGTAISLIISIIHFLSNLI